MKRQDLEDGVDIAVKGWGFDSSHGTPRCDRYRVVDKRPHGKTSRHNDTPLLGGTYNCKPTGIAAQRLDNETGTPNTRLDKELVNLSRIWGTWDDWQAHEARRIEAERVARERKQEREAEEQSAYTVAMNKATFLNDRMAAAGLLNADARVAKVGQNLIVQVVVSEGTMERILAKLAGA